MKIKLYIEYDGTKFFGWQKQESVISVQETIEIALEKVFNCEEKITLFGAGRTDTGVHAIEQVAHFDLNSEKLIEKWKDNCSKLPLAINFYMHDMGCAVKRAEVADDNFHARFSAIQRVYKYVIYNNCINSPININRVWHIARKLDIESMKKASEYLLGTHDFSAFRSSDCQAKNPVRTIDFIEIKKENDFVFLEIAARSFLHNQVRIITGTLKEVGIGKFSPEYVKFLLEKKDRTLSGVSAPPFGLYFSCVKYF